MPNTLPAAFILCHLRPAGRHAPPDPAGGRGRTYVQLSGGSGPHSNIWISVVLVHTSKKKYSKNINLCYKCPGQSNGPHWNFGLGPPLPADAMVDGVAAWARLHVGEDAACWCGTAEITISISSRAVRLCGSPVSRSAVGRRGVDDCCLRLEKTLVPARKVKCVEIRWAGSWAAHPD